MWDRNDLESQIEELLEEIAVAEDCGYYEELEHLKSKLSHLQEEYLALTGNCY